MKRLLLLPVLLAACTPGAREAGIRDGLSVAICVAEHPDEPIDRVLLLCARNVPPEDVVRVFQAQRENVARRVCPP